MRITMALGAAALVGMLAVAGTDEAAAQSKKGSTPATCVDKAATGTNTTRDGAMFQAWEAVLQATDWGSWASFMSSGAKVGTAPGYKVSRVQSRCAAGGLGFNCKMQARLCK